MFLEKLSIQEIVEVTQGKLIGKKETTFLLPPQKISTDTRKLKKGDLFIALEGKRFDGHRFVEKASEEGACGAIISEPIPLPSSHFFFIQVKDTLFALQEIARHHQKKFSLPLVGITGSNGKTTVKEMAWQILSSEYPTLKSEGNFNNQIGVPLSLLKLRSYHKLGVLEMGMNSKGEIHRLAEIIQPTIGVITNIQHSHIGFLGSLAQIMEAKAELIGSLNKEERNWLVLNSDDPRTPELQKRAKCRIITFGVKNQARVRAEEIAYGDGGLNFILVYRKKRMPMPIPIPGLYNVYNALAASAISLILNVSLHTIARSLECFKLPPMHSEISFLGSYQLIDDSYNANPESVNGALELLQSIGKHRKIVILGDMLELGKMARSLHNKVGRRAGELGIDALFTLGEFSKDVSKGARMAGLKNVFPFRDKERLIAKLLPYLEEGDSLLVKGSRGMKMEEIVKRLKERLCFTI